MNIKFVFHALAIIAGIFATVFGISDSKNKIILVIVALIIAGVFELAIPFLKTEPELKIFYFPDFFDFKDHQKEKEFDYSSKALQKKFNPDARCPCGSGKKYFECHNPELIQNEKNLWRGPNFPQNIYLGYKEKFDGIEFKKKEKSEIILLKEGTKIPLCRYFSMNGAVLNNKAIIRKLSVEQKGDDLIFSGSIEIESEFSEEVQFLVGTSDMKLINSFKTTNNSYENGDWFAFIDLGDNPLSADVAFQWYRYFVTRGYKINLMPNKQIDFEMNVKISDKNIFTLSLPFNDIELVCPPIATTSAAFEISLELERENIYWDLVIDHNKFKEKTKKQNDSLLFLAELSPNKAKHNAGVRKAIKGPRKIKISLLKKE